jgi:hypothetical protein
LRPKRLADLKEILNISSHFLGTIRNETGEDKPFTEVEVTALEKLINTTIVSCWFFYFINSSKKVMFNFKI